MTAYQRSLQILGLREGASSAEIKSAFRRKAKLYHPDVNKSEKAQEQFLKLKKAYEYALVYKVKGNIFAEKKNANPTNNKKYGTHKNWNSEQNQEYRAKARKRAEKRKQEYLNSEQYKESLLFQTFFNYMALAIVVILFLAIFYFPITLGMHAWSLAPVFFVAGFSIWWAYVRRQFSSLSFYEFKTTFYSVKKTYKFWVGLLSLTNVLLFLFFSMKTVIHSWGLIFAFVTLITSTKFFFKYVQKSKNVIQNYWALGMVPFCFNILFLTNYVFSGEVSMVTTEYSFTPYEGEKGSFDDGLIFLKNKKYEEVFFMRMFFNQKVNESSHITYQEETGLFGIKVVKNYTFSGQRRR